MDVILSREDGEGSQATSSEVLRSAQDDVLTEILAALDMPRSGLLRWFDHNTRFCMRHGGQRRYGEWLELYEQCRAALEANDAR